MTHVLLHRLVIHVSENVICVTANLRLPFQDVNTHDGPTTLANLTKSVENVAKLATDAAGERVSTQPLSGDRCVCQVARCKVCRKVPTLTV